MPGEKLGGLVGGVSRPTLRGEVGGSVWCGGLKIHTWGEVGGFGWGEGGLLDHIWRGVYPSMH